jgi:CubicO group peptidase (beta-lactamase class C family)
MRIQRVSARARCVAIGATVLGGLTAAFCGLALAGPAGAASTTTPTTGTNTGTSTIGAGTATISGKTVPMTGSELQGMSAWDTAAENFMTGQGIPGGTLIVGYEGRVLLERGYGYANVASKAPVEPTDAFRLASVSKSLTYAAIGQLIAQHKLTLNEKPFTTVLRSLRGPHGEKPVDRRVYDITIKDLLEHKGGWDISKIGFDPTTPTPAMYKAMGINEKKTTMTAEQDIEYMLGQKLNFTPGTKSVYSNLGYTVLGDIIAHVMHNTYGAAMHNLVFGPLGMTHTAMALNPPTRKRKTFPDEVTYYGQTVYDTGSQSPYSKTNPQTTGWGAFGTVSTAQDLLRYATIVSGNVPGTKPWPDPDPTDSAAISARPGGGFGAFTGSEPGVSTAIGVDHAVIWVFLGNSRNPEKTLDYNLFADAYNDTQIPSGNLYPQTLP